MKTKILPLVLALFAPCMAGTARAELKVGDPAPAATGVTEEGKPINLADVYASQTYTLIYFYPKAMTSGCTAQGCSLRDANAELRKRGVAVLGVSLDNAAAQAAFKEKYHFPFTLIADPEHKVVDAFGVPVRQWGVISFAKREAFLVKGGKIVWADYDAKTDKQADDVVAAIDALKG